MSLSQIVNVVISRNTAAVDVASFGIPMFMAEDNSTSAVIPVAERIRKYTDATTVATEWGANSAAHLAASAFFAQNPSVSEFLVASHYTDAGSGSGSITGTVAPDSAATIIAIVGGGFSIDVDGKSYTVSNVDFTGDVTENDIAATLQAAINAAIAAVETGQNVPTVTVAYSTYYSITSDSVGRGSEVSELYNGVTGLDEALKLRLVDNPTFAVGTGGDANISAAVIDANKKDSSWYVGTVYQRNEAGKGGDDVAATDLLVEFAQAVAGVGVKLAFIGTGNAAAYARGNGGTEDVITRLANNDRVVVYYNHAARGDHDAFTGGEANPYPECAFAGYNLPFEAGQATWAYLQLNGVQAARFAGGLATDPELGATEVANVLDKNGNLSQTLAGQTITREGKVTSGEWIDIIRGIDNLDEDVTKDLFQLLVSQQGGKIPYTNGGLNQVKGVISNVLTRYVNRGFIVNNFVIKVPDANSVSQNDKANRVLNGVSFVAQLQGAVHAINVQGNVTYSVPA
tara:strand:- start:35144 stop:36685 length:1542 start_codon:yes stop_codon:yes gene_type:complete